MSRLVEVAFPLPLDATFTYDLPESESEAVVGQRVLAPLARRTMTGYIVSFPLETTITERKEIEAVLDDTPILTQELIELARSLTERHGATLGDAIQVITPPGLERQSRRIIVANDKLGAPAGDEERRTLERIRQGRGLDFISFMRRNHGARPVLRRLERDGWVRIEARIRRERASLRPKKDRPTPESGAETRPPVSLSPDQENACAKIREALNQPVSHTFLLHGITGSGKTEVYLQGAAETLSRGKTVLAMVPEISLTPQFVGRFTARFGERVAVLHSARNASQRLTAWNRIRRGEATVVIGARSAVFAPLDRIGLLILDEEHDPSYKQDEGPLGYHARDVAHDRATRHGSVLVLGSATPSMESYSRARDAAVEILALPTRVTQHALPHVTTIDLRGRVSRFGQQGLISEELQEAMTETMERGDQVILFLNRRGFAPVVICPSCSESLRCSHCSVTLTYHGEEALYLCHYCGRGLPKDTPCVGCKKAPLIHLGVGTERVEQEIQHRFPDARVARMDRDSVKKPGKHQDLFRALAKREIDILIGTQMVTKGLDLPHVALVGVLLADQSLHFPDFRAAERTFQLITQVVGRAGRGARVGRAMVQTFQPDHYAIRTAVAQDFTTFYETEEAYRKELNYPPFSSLALIELSGESSHDVRKAAIWLAAQCRKLGHSRGIDFVGPAPAPLRKVKGRERYHLLIRSPRGVQAAMFGRWLLGKTKDSLAERKVAIHLDIDPQQFL